MLHTKEERSRTTDKKGKERDRIDERRVTRREGREREESTEWKIVFRSSHTELSTALAYLSPAFRETSPLEIRRLMKER